MSMPRGISDKLKFMLEEVRQVYQEYKSVYGRIRETVLKTYNQCLSEGLSPFEAKELIFTFADKSLHRNIYRILPDECKDKRMQELASRRKALPIGNDGLQDKLALKSMSSSQSLDNDSNSDIFMRDLRAELDNRNLSERACHMSKLLGMVDEKDKIIQELKKRIELTNNYGADWLMLSPDHSRYIYEIVSRNVKEGLTSEFSLAHDGYRITQVEDLSSWKRHDGVNQSK